MTISGFEALCGTGDEPLTFRCCVTVLRAILHGVEEFQLDTKCSIYDHKLVSNLRKELRCSDLFVYLRPGGKPQLWCQLSAAGAARSICCQMLRFRRSILLEKHLFQLKYHHSNLGRHQKDLQEPDSLHYKEAVVVHEILQEMPKQLQGVPFLLRYEWHVEDKRHKGVGDLVFTDGHSLYIVVEVKHIHNNPTAKKKSEYRRQRRQKVEQQAEKYYRQFCKEHAGAFVLAATYTNDRKLQWLKLDGQTAAGIAAVTEAAAHLVSMNPWSAAGMAATTHSASQSVSMKLLPRQELPVAHMNDVDEHEDQTEAGTSGQAADDDKSSSVAEAALVGGLIVFGLAVYLTQHRRRANVVPRLLFAFLIFMLTVLMVAIYTYY